MAMIVISQIALSLVVHVSRINDRNYVTAASLR